MKNENKISLVQSLSMRMRGIPVVKIKRALGRANGENIFITAKDLETQFLGIEGTLKNLNMRLGLVASVGVQTAVDFLSLSKQKLALESTLLRESREILESVKSVEVQFRL